MSEQTPFTTGVAMYVHDLEARLLALTSERNAAVSQREIYEEEASRNRDIAEGWKERALAAEGERDAAVSALLEIAGIYAYDPATEAVHLARSFINSLTSLTATTGGSAAEGITE